MMPGHCIAVVLLSAAAPAMAESPPTQIAPDTNRQTIDYDAGQIVQLFSALGYQLMVELSPDEQVKSVALGDSAAWQINVDKEGNRLFLKPMRSDERTNMTVITSVRTYTFDLQSLAAPVPDMPYTVSFRYPPRETPSENIQYVDVSAAIRRSTKYRISGDQEIRPQSVSDDGRHTYIIWPKNRPIPAIYARDHSGKESLVNGMMGTDDVYIINGVPRLLTFRIDHTVARAERILPPRSR